MTRRSALRERRRLTDATVGLLLAIALVLGVGVWSSRFLSLDANLALLVSYLAVWLPLSAAALVASLRHGSSSLARDFGLRFRPIDLLWGLAIGLLARVVASLIEIAVYGQIGTAAPTLGVPVYDAWWLFGALLAPVVLAPVIEELFFRGLLLRAVRGALRGNQVLATILAIAVSGAAFALVHVLLVPSVPAFAAVGLSSLIFGLAAATIAVLTGRLGGAIIAHVTFNALVVLPAILP